MKTCAHCGETMDPKSALRCFSCGAVVWSEVIGISSVCAVVAVLGFASAFFWSPRIDSPVLSWLVRWGGIGLGTLCTLVAVGIPLGETLGGIKSYWKQLLHHNDAAEVFTAIERLRGARIEEAYDLLKETALSSPHGLEVQVAALLAASEREPENLPSLLKEFATSVSNNFVGRASAMIAMLNREPPCSAALLAAFGKALANTTTGPEARFWLEMGCKGQLGEQWKNLLAADGIRDVLQEASPFLDDLPELRHHGGRVGLGAEFRALLVTSLQTPEAARMSELLEQMISSPPSQAENALHHLLRTEAIHRVPKALLRRIADLADRRYFWSEMEGTCQKNREGTFGYAHLRQLANQELLRREKSGNWKLANAKPARPKSGAPPGSDTLVVTCACGAKFRAKSVLAGKRVKCTKCGTLIGVPSELQR